MEYLAGWSPAQIDTTRKTMTNVFYTALQIGISAALSTVAIVVLVGIVPERASIPIQRGSTMSAAESILVKIESVPAGPVPILAIVFAGLAFFVSLVSVWLVRRQ